MADEQNVMDQANHLVASILEDSYDQHVKAYDRIKSYDGAVSTFKDLIQLKHKSISLMNDLGRAIGYERALANVMKTRTPYST